MIEQAKGVLAREHDLEMDQAYLWLRELAQEDGRSLTETAGSCQVK